MNKMFTAYTSLYSLNLVYATRNEHHKCY